jgi:hypothetical protein
LHRRRRDQQQQQVGDGANRDPLTARSGHESGDGERRQQRGARHDPALRQQICQRMPQRHRQQRHEHAEAILPPVERRPALRADQDRQQRIGVPEIMKGPEAHPCGQAGNHDRDDDPWVTTHHAAEIMHLTARC